MQNVMVQCRLVLVLYPPQKFECPPFGKIEATVLKLLRRGHLQWHDPLADFNEKLPTVSKVITEGHTDRQHGDRISLTFLSKDSRLKLRMLNYP
jgi:hypothetical protein